MWHRKATEGLVVVEMGEAHFLTSPDSIAELPTPTADPSETAQWRFSFSVSEAAFLAGLQADFLRPL